MNLLWDIGPDMKMEWQIHGGHGDVGSKLTNTPPAIALSALFGLSACLSPLVRIEMRWLLLPIGLPMLPQEMQNPSSLAEKWGPSAE